MKRRNVAGGSPGKKSIVWLVCGLVVACVGSEEGSRDDSALERSQALQTPAAPSYSFGRDTASVLSYRIAETVVDIEDPRKITVHILSFEKGETATVSATLRSTLDSIGSADPELAAARAILYTARTRENGIIDFVPAAWAVWAPPEGWSEAQVSSRSLPYRTIVYHTRPGWTGRQAEAGGGRSRSTTAEGGDD